MIKKRKNKLNLIYKSYLNQFYQYYKMAAPWYECQGPNTQYVYDDMLLVMSSSTEWKRITNMKQNVHYKFKDIANLSLIIKKCMATEFDKHGGFGSFRGYGTFTRYALMKDIKKKLVEEYYKTKAIDIIKNSNIVSNWMNHILYRPPGPRYMFHKNSFETSQNQ